MKKIICFLCAISFTVPAYDGNYSFGNYKASSCWFNASLQCLLKLKPLSDLLLVMNPDNIPEDESEGEFLREYIKFNKKINDQSQKGKVFKDAWLKPKGIYEALVNANFVQKGEQKNALNFIREFVLTRCFLKKEKIADLFKFETLKVFNECESCGEGGTEVCVPDYYYRMQLHKEMADPFIKQFSDRNIYGELKCKECGGGGEFFIDFITTPKIFIILQRISSIGTVEVTHKIAYPLQLDVAPRMHKSAQKQNTVYDLSSICVGTENHSYAYARDFDSGKWYYYNDIPGCSTGSQEMKSLGLNSFHGVQELGDKQAGISNLEAIKTLVDRKYPKYGMEVICYVRSDVSGVVFSEQPQNNLSEKVSQLTKSLGDLAGKLNSLKNQLNEVKGALGS